MYTVHIKPYGYNLFVNENETVLAAALRQGYNFPHDCKTGICGSCKGLLLEGQVEYDELFLAALNEDEREAGYALFCSAKPLTDLIIHIDGVIGPESIAPKKLVYSVKSLEQLNPTIYRVILLPPPEDYIRYHAGQYVEIIHRDTSPRPFSIANAPLADDHAIEIHIRHLANNPSSTELLTEIKTGQLQLKGPFGNNILRREPLYPMIFAAGGAGIAPIKALIEQALAEGSKQPIYLYWGVRVIADFYLQELVTRWEKYIPHFHYIPVLSGKKESANWKGRTGWVHEAIIKDHPNLTQFHIYASGPTEMVYAAFHTFTAHGLNRSLMYSDALDYQL